MPRGKAPRHSTPLKAPLVSYMVSQRHKAEGWSRSHAYKFPMDPEKPWTDWIDSDLLNLMRVAHSLRMWDMDENLTDKKQ